LAKHLYVLDTCVLLHDPMAVYKFHEHDIYIPLAVIDDLDEIKTRKDTVGWSAREVFRILDEFDEQQLTKGVKVTEQGGKLFVYNGDAPLTKNERPVICRVNSDNAIIDTCLRLMAKFPKRKVSVVTKDTGLRVRAISWGCIAENYRSDLLEQEPYTGIRHVTVSNNQEWDLLWQNPEVDPSKLSGDLSKQLSNLAPYEFIFFKNGNSICPAVCRGGKIHILKDKSNGQSHGKPEFKGIHAKNIEQRCALEALADDKVPLVCLLGPAGTGKTLLSLAVSLERIEQGVYDRIIVIKPLIPVGGKDIGALPGDKWEKLSAWLGPMRDNIQQLVHKDGMGKAASGSFEELVEEGKIEVEAMAFIQGRSIPNSVVIVDECQNLTPREARMVVERCGKGSKVILLGDLTQVENPFLDSRSCGLAHAVSGGKNLELCAVATLTKVERSELAALASEIFKRPEARR